jgi:hypothetical protein
VELTPDPDEEQVLGTVVRLQVQRSPLKPGPRGARAYDPAPLLEVAALEVGPRGVLGLPRAGTEAVDGPVLDVHHADHPAGKNRGANGLSLLPRAHYERMRQRFGPHLVDGTAGESVLLDTPVAWGPEALAGPLELETADGGRLALDRAAVAAPCVEFSRFCLGRGPGSPDDDELVAALDALDGGTRGFYVTALGTGRIEVGARLLRPSPGSRRVTPPR